ncbi:dienelactone hydrolase family protein [Stutzerimonas tarimensis]|uniref:Dienelactone hydrolase family protein n=1 Tax=Stutzerimonas tarimensis TaxID=1507735 RepID=A0ABV7T1P9_9GAMM
MRLPLFSLLLIGSSLAYAEVQTQEVTYTAADGTRLVGYYAFDDALGEQARPGVLVVHEWWGLNEYAKRRARDLAELGYSALAIDMYGEGRNTEHPKDAMSFMQQATQDAEAAKARFVAALDLLREQPRTAEQIGAVGYCFGGRVVLDMARQGVPLAGVVSFHGALGTETRAAPGNVTARVLVQHGGADSMVSAEDVGAFNAEMVQADADYRFINYPGARHGFTNPDADRHQAHGVDVAYDQQADERSWAAMRQFLEETFAR